MSDGTGSGVVAAGIDCGTNSIRLLVAEVAPDGSVRDLAREMTIVRLGQGVDATGRLAPEAIERTRVALAAYRATIDRLGARQVRMVATSATRDASNREDFVAVVRDTLGADPEVISGREEAGLSFRGAVHDLAARADLPELARPDADVLVIDLGGGSTELVRGRTGTPGAVRAHSMDVGCVRMTERHLVSDPPTPQQVAAVVADVHAALDAAEADVDLRGADAVVGVAGTVTTVAAIALDLPRYDPDVLDGAVVTADDVAAVAEQLLTSTRAQRAAIGSMHPGRVDIIGAGALVLRTVLERTGATRLVASEHDILDGITVSAARR